MSLVAAGLVGLLSGAVGMALGWWARGAFGDRRAESGSAEDAEVSPSADDSPSDEAPADARWSEDDLFVAPETPRDRLRALALEVDDVNDVYRRIGYNPRLDDEVAAIQQALRDRIVVTIPDPSVFRDALHAARDEMDTLPDTETADDGASVRRAIQLFEDVWARRDDLDAVRGRLAERPVDEQLPFIERIPVVQSASVRWRTPARVSVLRKQPDDEAAYRRLLDRLATLVAQSDLPRSDRTVTAVRTAIGRMQRDFDADDAYVPTLLGRVDEAVDAWRSEVPSEEARARKERFDSVLVNVLTLHAAARTLLDDPDGRAATSAARERLRTDALEQIRAYVDAPWMQVPWLTDRLTAALIAAETTRARHDSHVEKSVVRRLRTVGREVAARDYDPTETARRLRACADDGHGVHSLVFALLRMRAASPEAS